MPKVAVILFPGLNTEIETLRACQKAGLESEIFRWNDDYSKLKKFDAYIVPGGFSYEDRGRSGVIASKDPIMQTLKKEVLNGKPGLGICNGAQIFVEAGFIPGLEPGNLQMALAPNERIQNGKILGTGYYNDWVYMKHESKSGRSVFNRFPATRILHIPIAHGEGRFTTRDKKILETLIKNEQTLFRYCDKNGKISHEFPINPNGSMYNLAGICNPEGNIVALMPHTERSEANLELFYSLADYLKSSKKTLFKTNADRKEASKKLDEEMIETGEKKPDITILVRLIITDNEEKTIENTIKRIGYHDIKLQRQIFIGLWLKNKKNLKKTAGKLISSGELLNLHKEIPTIFIGKKVYNYSKSGLKEIKNPLPKNFNFYVSEYNHYSGKNLQSTLRNHLKDNFIEKVERGVFWTFQMKNLKKINEVVQTHIFHNPHSMRIVAF